MLRKNCNSGYLEKGNHFTVFKGKGKDVMDPLSYRPVSLISNPCKGRSCQDHVFTLTMAIKARLLQKKSTYCCFVDFAAAFDNVDRDLLIFALQNIGVEGHILKVIREMYRHKDSFCSLYKLFSKRYYKSRHGHYYW